MMDVDLSGRTAIITGAGRGIGRSIADVFAKNGANIVAAARTTSEIESCVDDIESEYSVEALAVPTDLMEVDDIHNLIETSVEAFGTPEILINNAGLNYVGNPLEHTLEEVDEMLAVNLRGLFLLSQRWAQQFREEPVSNGRIINISSVSAQIGVSAMTLYGGTNAGIYGITRGFAAEMAKDDVTVNSITPGMIRVERIARVIEEKGDQLYELDRFPLDRAGEPEEVAYTCLFLASDEAAFITGVDLPVDGGVTFTAGFIPSDL